jgi:phosphoribosylamine--glycine ligase
MRHTTAVSSVLVVGNGAREHTLCAGLRQSADLALLYCAPGNAGTAALAENIPIALDNIDGLVDAAVRLQVDLVVVGPEAPLAAGLVDRLRAAGVAAFGPGAAAARIESSKAWAKEIMRAAGVATARAEVATSLVEARRLLDRCSWPLVLKADGLAAGKGVSIVQDRAEAEAVLDDLFVSRSLGAAADAVLIEECMVGPELSVLALTDGEAVAVLPPARDYKRIGEGNTGPNTGGMGAFSRPGFATPGLLAQVEAEILRPTLQELSRRGLPFAGTLYAGLMLTSDGPRVIEFNCRFGDPETQVILPLLASDLLTHLCDVAHGRLDPSSVRWSDGVGCGVVLASGGYPGVYQTGLPIAGLDALPDDIRVFQAGTAHDATGRVVTAGGRVLTVVAVQPDLSSARARAYAAADAISFEGCYLRRDVGADDWSA